MAVSGKVLHDADLLERISLFLNCDDLLRICVGLGCTCAAVQDARRVCKGAQLCKASNQLDVASCLPPCRVLRNEARCWELRVDHGPRLDTHGCEPEVHQALINTVYRLATKRQYVRGCSQQHEPVAILTLLGEVPAAIEPSHSTPKIIYRMVILTLALRVIFGRAVSSC